MGAYCAACGERFLSVEDFEIHHFLLEHLPHEVLHIDGKLARTLRVTACREAAQRTKKEQQCSITVPAP